MNFTNIRRALSIGLILTLTATSGVVSAETVLAAKKVKVYQKPSTEAASVKISAGTTLEVTGEKDGWLRVERGGNTAYIPADDVVEVVDCDGATGYLSEDAALYKAYGKDSKHGTMLEGAKVTVYSVAGDWAYAGYKGKKGFVRVDSLTKTKPEVEEEAVEEEKIETIVLDGKAAYAVEGAKVYKKNSTDSKVLGNLALNTRLSVEATRGDWACVTLNGAKGFMKLSDLMDEKEKVDEASKETVSAQGRAKTMDWWDSGIQDIFSRGTVATFTDVATGISWKEVRKGGTNHADCQPLTEADTAALKRACGKWSWDRRAIFVTIDGVNYAASMNCMAHGGGSISNGFNGHHCVHFTNSRTHGTNIVCPDHKAAIAKAANAKL